MNRKEIKKKKLMKGCVVSAVVIGVERPDHFSGVHFGANVELISRVNWF